MILFSRIFAGLGVSIFLNLPLLLCGQAFLHTPIEGEMNKDWIIVNYVDWSADTSNPILDAHCGNKTYDGHQGTDFTIRSFRQMDSGVNILAAADGVVTFIQDGMFDRETQSVPSKGLGNYVAIRHSNKYYTYYGHLKKNSISVRPGDTVKAGQPIGLVASSGNSTDPHLHFELWYDSMYVVDPFNGPCGNPGSLWLEPQKYDTSLRVLESGLIRSLPTLDELRERLPEAILFDQNETDDTPCLWSLMTGIRAGDSLVIEWINPEGKNEFSYTFQINRDWWYYYFWSYIDHTIFSSSSGEWTVRLNHNDEEIVLHKFLVVNEMSIVEHNLISDCEPKKHGVTFYVYDTQGRLVLTESADYESVINRLGKGVYYVVWSSGSQRCFKKLGLVD